jgi:hypothetical protein
LLALRAEEIARGVTTIGPQRDELRLLSNGVDLGDFGSRGQVRTTLLALKLAEVTWMKDRTGHGLARSRRRDRARRSRCQAVGITRSPAQIYPAKTDELLEHGARVGCMPCWAYFGSAPPALERRITK